MATTVKQREYALTVDRFNNPASITGKDAIRILITRLLLLEPGSDPLHPEMGVGIAGFRFSSGQNTLQTLKDRIKKQLDLYLPEFSSSNIKLTLNGKEHTLRIEITVGDTTYLWSSSTDDSNSTILDLKNS